MIDRGNITMPALFDVGSLTALNKAKAEIAEGKFGDVQVLDAEAMKKHRLAFTQFYRPESRKVEIAVFGVPRAIDAVMAAYEFNRPSDEFDPVYKHIYL